MLVYLHGFTDNPQKSSFLSLRLAVEAGLGTCVNILALDAGSLLKCFYLRATTIVTFIGRVLGEAFASLILAGLNPSKIHLIGHSLGAHVAGFAGKEVYKRTGSNIGRITALDPAGPCFSAVEPTLGLFKTDADFVDVMHTDAGVYGMGQAMGHVDFWVNGGSQQPGCVFQTCSHGRSLEYFAESMVAPAGFIGVRCNSYFDFRQGKCDLSDMSVMGYYTLANITGDYYLISAGQSPFGTGALGTTYKTNDFVRGIAFAIRDAFLNLWRRIMNRSN
ncbi:hypothetical protein PYW07_009787 [Mythimna separata]|uniref:Lipase domain-containing protein n=1 Tax=Mythimna separata TaxID=271217 RepID=A0AAD8DNG7_MYTSE|nr:hypothetical protein PYW07_009787 [Mythimna separata]